MAWSYDPTDLNTTTASGRLFKFCAKCDLNKPVEDFTKNPSSKDGLYSMCKTCKQSKDREYRKNNREEIRNRNTNYYNKNKISWFSYNAGRRAVFKKAKPVWLTDAQKRDIEFTYSLAQECKTLTGENYHVDHIVPLRGENVCGLHVPWNLQVIPSDMNLSKTNKFEGGW